MSKETSRLGDKAPKYLLLLSVVFAMFLGGMAVERFHFPPYEAIHKSWQDLKDLRKFWKWNLGLVPLFHLVHARTPGADTQTIVREGAKEGYRILSGVFPKRAVLHGAIVLDREGNEIHYWPIDYNQLDPDGPGAWHVTLHGFETYSDGSIIVNFDGGNILARLNNCGMPLWKTPGKFNHVIGRSYDGTIWTWEDGSGDTQHWLVQVDPTTGRILRRIHLLNDLIYANGPGRFFMRQDIDETNLDEKPATFLHDPFHPNSVAILGPDWAPRFSGFSPGDILISLRNVNFVGVFDPKSLKMKWGQNGPWHRQHDADFTEDGEISILNNNSHQVHSEIVRINPQSGKYRIVFAGNEAVPFYTRIFGKHQNLSNGSMLITESLRGAALEVDRNGQLVWEYNNRYDSRLNGVLNSAAVVPEGFFDRHALECISAPSK